MTLNITDPTTNKTYTYKGFVPLTRITDACQSDFHSDCMSVPQDLVSMLGFDFAKRTCCLCSCHFAGKVGA